MFAYDSDSVYFNHMYIYKYIHNIYIRWHSITYNCGHRLRYRTCTCDLVAGDLGRPSCLAILDIFLVHHVHRLLIAIYNMHIFRERNAKSRHLL